MNTNKQLNILITDGNYKHTLGILRNLPKKAHKTILITTPRHKSLCYYSKYCDNVIRLPININEDIKLNLMISELKKKKYDVLIPVGLDSCTFFYKNAAEISKYVLFMYPIWEAFVIATEKDKTMQFAKTNGVPIPKTTLINSETNLNGMSEFPLVLKPAGGTGGKVYYCNSIDELHESYAQYKEGLKILCQEYISGFGCGYFGLYANGECLASFMHKRVKEYPISGGPSVCAESFYDERLKQYGEKLCKALNWTGPIMCEFKYDSKNDDYKLIEINPKFWGSLELTLEAGVNIPDIMVKYLLGEDIQKITTYKKIRYRWILSGEFLHFLETGKKEPICEFLKLKEGEVSDIRLSDPIATLYSFISMLINIRKSKKQHEIKK